MRLEKGDDFYVAETRDGLRISEHNPEVKKQIRPGRGLMKVRCAALRKLANEQPGAGPTARH